MAVSPLIVNNFIDSCAFDPKYEPETTAANRLHELSNKGALLLQIAHSTQKELEHPNTPSWVKQKAEGLIYTIQVDLTDGERAVFGDIRKILVGNGKVENILQDAQHVFEAQKYGHYFVTTDKRILDKAAELKKRCGVNIMLPSKFLVLTEQFMAEKNGTQERVRERPCDEPACGLPRTLEHMEENSMNGISYKGYLIRPAPLQLADTGEWSLELYIGKDRDSEYVERKFSAGNKFNTEEAAVKHCVKFGKQIIDGKSENYTVADL